MQVNIYIPIYNYCSIISLEKQHHVEMTRRLVSV